MKTVFGSIQEVCHIWASRSQYEGSAGNVYFRSGTIYSYGSHFPMARFVSDDTVLVNSGSYSVTTSGHQSAVRSAIGGHYTTFCVPDVDVYDVKCKSAHEDNLLYLCQEFITAMNKAKRATAWDHYTNAIGAVNSMRKYVKHFKLVGYIKSLSDKALYNVYNYDIADLRRLSKSFEEKQVAKEAYNRAHWPEIQAKREKAREQREELARKKEEKRQAKLWENLNQWKLGADIGTWNNLPYTTEAYLRIKDDKIETSEGANIPLSRAHNIWKLVYFVHNNGNTPYDSDSLRYESVNRFFAPYTLESISTDGDLTIGCHVIPYSELERIARQLKFIA